MAGAKGKSGRKRKDIKKVQLCASIDPYMFNMIEEIAEKHRWTISSAICYLTELGIQRYENELS